MKPTLGDAQEISPDLVAANVEALKALFPELITEGPDGQAANVDVLKQLLGGQVVTDADEKYGLNWFGKRRARQLALSPSTGTLRPSPEDSVDWDTTQNLMIEGDNLEVLKLLQKSYVGKVKLIYIDPPYNTGKDFVYPDDYRDNIQNYLELTGQVAGGRKTSTNTETSGRFHTDWLNMMYPRLKLARHLLRDDGVILISIDDGELANLRVLCAEILGEENFLATIVWVSNLKGRQIAESGPVGTHEYILCFARNASDVGQFRASATKMKSLMPSVYKGSDYEIKHDVRGPYVTKNELYNTNSRFNEQTAPTMVFNIHHNFDTGDTRTSDVSDLTTFDGYAMAAPHRNARAEASYHAWRWSRNKVVSDAPELEFSLVGGELRVFTKIRDIDGMALKDIILGPSTVNGQEDLTLLGLDRAFDTPKPLSVLQLLLSAAAGEDSDEIIVDFFAGSGTTGHAVMAQNAADGGSRRYLLIQLPEPLDPDTTEQKAAAEFCDRLDKPRNIAELTKERLRRAAAKVKADNPTFEGDLGFRVFKLDSTNIRAWEPDRDDLEQTLLDHEEHLKADRTQPDILYELLLKLGLDLCVPMEERSIAGKAVHSIGGGVLLVCLVDDITRDEVEPLAQGIVDWHKELAPAGDTTCVFRDSAFADDVAKTNLAAILNQHGLQNVRSL